MAEKVLLSPQFALEARDFLKGLVVAVGTSVLVVVQEVLQSGKLVFDWKQIGTIALGSVVAYLAKNFFAKPQVTTVYSTNEQAKVVSEDIKSTQ